MSVHYPAHESLQEFAKRTGRTAAAAYDDWHSRPYPEVRVTRLREVFDDITGRRSLGFLKAEASWPARGPGLGL